MASSQNAPPPRSAHNVPVLTVGELAQALKRTVEDSFPLVRVRGEVSGYKRHSSGHVYFRLKDETAVLEAVCWRGTALKLGIAVEDGLDVVISGRLTTYAGRSQYQIVVDAIELAGEGALLKLLEDRKKKLAAEGLFDAERKVALPFLPEVIGVVTSPTGAVIRDILHRLRDRFPRRVLIWPVQVQGPGAAEQVAAAIAGFNRLERGGAVPRPDLLIVARGGGSLEDLWAFNEEVVVRAVAASDIPLISAVGHETDTTLIDYAADVRAPTPTAAAEMAVPVRLELMEGVLDLAHRLTACTARNLADRRAALAAGARGLPNLKRLLDASAQRLDEWAERLPQGLRNHVAAKRARVATLVAALPDPKREIALARRHFAQVAGGLAAPMRVRLAVATERLARFGDLLESLSYTRSLARGFVLVRAGEKPLTAAREVQPGLDVTLTFSDGEAGARITRVGASPPPATPTSSRRRRPPPGGSQGELL